MISETLNRDGSHGFAGIWGSDYSTFHHNLVANCVSRNMRFASGSGNTDFRNNVIYNWGYNSAYGGENQQVGDEKHNFSVINMVNNYYKPGPATSTAVNHRIVNPSYRDVKTDYGKFFVSGNYVYGNATVSADNWNGGVDPQGGSGDLSYVKLLSPWNSMSINEESAQDAYQSVLLKAGCSFSNRDVIDGRIINEVKNGTATFGLSGIIESQTEVGGWPSLNSTTAPIDSDHDGMPDSWEIAKGSNPYNASDRNVLNADGITALELYLNDLDAIYLATYGNVNLPVKTEETTSLGPGSVSWSLLSNQAANTSNIALNGYSERLGQGISGLVYNSTFTSFGSGWHRLATAGLPLAASDSSYSEYKVTVAPGYRFKLNAISLSAIGGGTSGVKLAVYYHLGNGAGGNIAFSNLGNAKLGTNPETVSASSFGSPLSLQNSGSTAASGAENISIPVDLTLKSDEAFTLRIYAWAGSVGKYLALKNVLVAGTLMKETITPLDLVNFEAKRSDPSNTKVVQLNWETVNELNTHSFVVEKGTDSRTFVAIATVPAINQSGRNIYRFVDKFPYSGTSYYRLKIIDKDGLFTHSFIEGINLWYASNLEVYPNPADEYLFLNLPLSSSTSTLTVRNSTGMLIATYHLAKGASTYTLPIRELPIGIYYVTVMQEAHSFTKAFVKR